jgi:hypothetical protein
VVETGVLDVAGRFRMLESEFLLVEKGFWRMDLQFLHVESEF